MRYYTYVSDDKIDMLYGQIPVKLLSKIVTELKLDIKVLSVSIKQRETDDTRYGKLEVVENYVKNHFDIGTVVDPTPWFCAKLDMRSGVYLDRSGHSLAHFSGEEDGTLLVLVGSTYHLIGEDRTKSNSMYVPMSNTRAVFSLAHSASKDEVWLNDRVGASDLALRSRIGEDAFTMMHLFGDPTIGIPESCEFLARQLFSIRLDHERATPFSKLLVGTPLYVALAEN